MLPHRLTDGERDQGYVTLMAAIGSALDRGRVIFTAHAPADLRCGLCPPALGPVAPAVALMRWTDTRLRKRRRRLPVCRSCLDLQLVRVLGDPSDDVRVAVLRWPGFSPTDVVGAGA